MPKKRGRPAKDTSRTINLNIRLSPAESELLKECAEKMGVPRTEVIVQGIKLVSERLK